MQSSHQPDTGFHPKCWLVPKIVPRVWVWVCSHKGTTALLLHSLSFHGMAINSYPSIFYTSPGTGLVFTDIQVPGTTPGIPDLPMWDQPLPGAVGPVPVFHAHTSLTPCSSCTKSTYKYKNNDNDNIKDESKRINA